MTLTHLFKIQALFAWMWVVMIWVAPDMVVEPGGWILTPNLESMLQLLSVPMLGLGILAWMAPAWTGDNVKTVGMFFGVGINLAFLAVQMLHVSTEAANFDPLGAIPTAILVVLFFWKSRA